MEEARPFPQDAAIPLAGDRAPSSMQHHSFLCSTWKEAEMYLKRALYLQKNQRFDSPILSVFFEIKENAIKLSPPLTLVFASKNGENFPELLNSPCPCDNHPAKPFEKVKNVHEIEAVKIYKASKDGLLVIVKTFTLNDPQVASKVLQEAFTQARLVHPHICEVLDICVSVSKKNFGKISLVLEQMAADMNQVATERKACELPFEEADLWEVFEQTLKAVKFIHDQVICM